jgi:hypothetical protein
MQTQLNSVQNEVISTCIQIAMAALSDSVVDVKKSIPTFKEVYDLIVEKIDSRLEEIQSTQVQIMKMLIGFQASQQSNHTMTVDNVLGQSQQQQQQQQQQNSGVRVSPDDTEMGIPQISKNGLRQTHLREQAKISNRKLREIKKRKEKLKNQQWTKCSLSTSETMGLKVKNKLEVLVQ